MEFQFGTNWAAFSKAAGGVIGQTLVMEGVFSRLLESSFLGLLSLRREKAPSLGALAGGVSRVSGILPRFISRSSTAPSPAKTGVRYTLTQGSTDFPITWGWFLGRPNSQVSSPQHWYPSSVDPQKSRSVVCQVGLPDVRGPMSAKEGQAQENTKVQQHRPLALPDVGSSTRMNSRTLGKARTKQPVQLAGWKR